MSGLRRAQAQAMFACGWDKDAVVKLHDKMYERHFSVYDEDDFIMPWGVLVEGCFMVYRSFNADDMVKALSWELNTKEPVVAYADGSGTTLDKPAGIGVYLLVPGQRPQFIAENIGFGTNNVAELRAIARALRAVPDCNQSMIIRSDSEYAIGSCTKDWTATANTDLVANIRRDLSCRKSVIFEHVDGHAKIAGNEIADNLAKIGRKWITKISEF